MAAIIGCTNPECTAYKKVHYKKDAKYCIECGEQLSFVCAKCWKSLDEGNNRYCISCKAKLEQKRAQDFSKVKHVGKVALGGLGTAATVVTTAATSSEKLLNGVKKIAAIATKIRL